MSVTSVVLEEYELLGDPKYRAFVTSVDKALKTFEYSSEWADLISALGKLNKVLVSHIKFPVVPRRITISKRLAQCLHPALPSGVHLKALETYDIIFKCIGTSRLSQELFIYSAGLFPLLGHAAMNVKNVLLNIYESHFVPLGERLRPGLLGFLIGVLPGLEEGSDHFERTDSLLLSVCNSVEQSFFYGCLWRCVLTNPLVRLPAITFVLLHFDKKKTMEDQLHLIGTDIDAMVQGMCAALQDSSVLVQRCALDLLLLGFSFHNSQLVQCDRVHVLESAVSVVLRRDMSLNRRLFAWLLGTEASFSSQNEHADDPKSHHGQKPSFREEEDSFSNMEQTFHSHNNVYFQTYSKDLLLLALRNCFTDVSTSLHCLVMSSHISGFPILWPYRILVSLLDRPEIGMLILEDILIEVFRSLYNEVNRDSQGVHAKTGSKCLTSNHDLKSGDLQKEVVKTANLLFASLEPSYLWEYIGKLFRKACMEAELQDTQLHFLGKSRIQEPTELVTEANYNLPSIKELCRLVAFLLDVINVETFQDTTTIHLPDLLATVGTLLSKYCNILTSEEFLVTFRLCSKILSKVQPTMCPTNILGLDESLQSKRSKRTASLESTSPSNLSWEKNKDPGLTCTSRDLETSMFSKENEALSPDQLCWFSLDVAENLETRHHEFGIDDKSLPNHSVLFRAVQVFQDFLTTFISLKMIPEKINISETFEARMIISNKDSQRERELQRLLDHCVNKPKFETGEEVPTSLETSFLDLFDVSGMFGVVKLDNNLPKAFEAMCQLLIELAAFPVYITSHPRSSPLWLQNPVLFDVLILPNWLKLMLLIGCFSEESHSHLCAISAVLELVALTHSSMASINSGYPQSSIGTTSNSQQHHKAVTCVVTLPMITESELTYITHRTRFLQLAANRLWHQVGKASSKDQLRAVELLQQIHNLSPHHPCHGSACDIALCHALTNKHPDIRMEASRKFCILWHLTRDMPAKSQGVGTVSRLFDRPLFLMLDQLSHPPGPLRTVAESWLSHCFQRGDIARVLQPLLLILLHQDTARVSIQHVSIYCPKNKRDASLENEHSEDLIEKSESQIYAISSVGGKVIYHVSGAEGSRPNSRPSSKHGSPDRRILALSSMVETKSDKKPTKIVTSHAFLPEYEFPCSLERNLTHPISVFINPFGSTSSLSSGTDGNSSDHPRILPDLTNVRRFDLAMLKKNYFDEIDSDDSDENEKVTNKDQTIAPQENNKENINGEEEITSNPSGETTETVSMEEFVSEMLDDIIMSAVKLSTSKQLETETLAENPATHIAEDNVNFPQEATEAQNVQESPTLEERLSSSCPVIHPLHAYLLIYTQVYDSQKVLYALTSFKAILLANPRMALWSMATTSVNQQMILGSNNSQDLQVLLARHRKSIFGNSFNGNLASEAVTTYRSSMFVEAIVTTCLYYLRGVYPNLPRQQQCLTQEEVLGNRKVRLLALETLTLVFAELVGIVRDSGRSFSSYLSDLLCRCKVQKILLHCLAACVFHEATDDQDPVPFSKVILDFNERTFDSNNDIFEDTMEVGLLRLVSKVIMLEDTIASLNPLPSSLSGTGSEARDLSKTSNGLATHGKNPSENKPFLKSRPENGYLAYALKYQPGLPVSSQHMLLTSVLTALRQNHRSHLHGSWLILIMTTLPFTGSHGGRSLVHLVIPVVSQLCLSLDAVTDSNFPYNIKSTRNDKKINTSGEEHKLDDDAPAFWPPDYLITLVEGLTTICHFCLLDTPSLGSTSVPTGTHATGGASTASSSSTSFSLGSRSPFMQMSANSSYNAGINATQIISNLLHVFSPSDFLNKDFLWGTDGLANGGCGATIESLLSVRRTLLSNLPRIVATLSILWRLLSQPEEWNDSFYQPTKLISMANDVEHNEEFFSKQLKHQELLKTMGPSKVVKQHILSFLSPLSVHYGSHFIAAVAVVWQDFKSQKPARNRPNSTCQLLFSTSNVRKIFPSWSHEQQQLVALVGAIKVLPLESVVQTVRQVLKQPPPTACDENQKRIPLEVSLLQFFLAYMQTSTGSALVESWPSLLALWKEGLQLSASSNLNSSNNGSSNGSLSQSGTSSALPIVQLHLIALLHEFVQKAPMLEDKKDQRDLQDVAQKLIDTCSIIAGSSLEQTNWLRRNLAVRPGPQPDLLDDEETDSQNGVDKGNEGSSRRNSASSGPTLIASSAISNNAQYSVQALQCLAEFLAPIMDVVYVSEEKEKVISLLNNIMYYVSPYLRNHRQV